MDADGSDEAIKRVGRDGGPHPRCGEYLVSRRPGGPFRGENLYQMGGELSKPVGGWPESQVADDA